MPWEGRLDHALLTRDQEVDLSRRYRRAVAQNDADEARRLEDEFVAHNVKLIFSIARKRHQRAGGLIDLRDLYQEGAAAIVLAFRRWDPERGPKFSTYGVRLIDSAVRRHLVEHRSAIRVPEHRAKKVARIRRAQSELAPDQVREPTTAEVARYLSESTRAIEAAIESTRFNSLASIDTPVLDDDSAPISAILRASDEPSPDHRLLQGMERSALWEAVDRLGPSERRVLQLRFGMVDDEPRRLEWIGQRIGLTRQRIQQIEKSALRKLREDAALLHDLDRAA